MSRVPSSIRACSSAVQVPLKTKSVFPTWKTPPQPLPLASLWTTPGKEGRGKINRLGGELEREK
jgi:hypothetical protein